MSRFFTFFLCACLHLLAPQIEAAAVAPPQALAATAIQQDNSSVLSWTNDVPAASQWYIYLNGNLTYQPLVANTTLNGGRREFVMRSLPVVTPVVVNMRAVSQNPLQASGLSAAITLTGQAFIRVLNPDGIPVQVSIASPVSGTAAGVDVTVTAETSATAISRTEALVFISVTTKANQDALLALSATAVSSYADQLALLAVIRALSGTAHSISQTSTAVLDGLLSLSATAVSAYSDQVATSGVVRAISATSASISATAAAIYNDLSGTSQGTQSDPTYINFLEGNLDAFARIRFSQPFTVFDSKQVVDQAPLLWTTSTAGGGTVTYVSQTSSSSLFLPTTSGARALRQTKQYFNYQPGKSLLVAITAKAVTGTANTVQRIGYYDDQNGVFFQISGTVVSVVVRSSTSGSVVDTAVSQTAWNIDPVNGAGPSGLTADFSKAQIFFLDFEWLGVGAVRFGIEANDRPVYVHRVSNFNALSAPYMRSPNLPVRYEALNVGTSAGLTLTAICATVISEGGVEPRGYQRTASNGASGKTFSDTNIHPLVQIRLKSTAKEATISDIKASVMSNSVAYARYVVILNPTVSGGAAASYVSLTNSAIEYDLSATGDVSGGTEIYSAYFANAGNEAVFDILNALPLAQDYNGTRDVIAVCIQGTAGTNETFFGALSWREIY